MILVCFGEKSEIIKTTLQSLIGCSASDIVAVSDISNLPSLDMSGNVYDRVLIFSKASDSLNTDFEEIVGYLQLPSYENANVIFLTPDRETADSIIEETLLHNSRMAVLCSGTTQLNKGLLLSMASDELTELDLKYVVPYHNGSSMSIQTNESNVVAEQLLGGVVDNNYDFQTQLQDEQLEDEEPTASLEDILYGDVSEYEFDYEENTEPTISEEFIQEEMSISPSLSEDDLLPTDTFEDEFTQEAIEVEESIEESEGLVGEIKVEPSIEVTDTFEDEFTQEDIEVEDTFEDEPSVEVETEPTNEDIEDEFISSSSLDSILGTEINDFETEPTNEDIAINEDNTLEDELSIEVEDADLGIEIEEDEVTDTPQTHEGTILDTFEEQESNYPIEDETPQIEPLNKKKGIFAKKPKTPKPKTKPKPKASKKKGGSPLEDILNNYGANGYSLVVTGTRSGNTTIVDHIGSILRDMGHRVLVVDLAVKTKGHAHITKSNFEAVHRLESDSSSLKSGLNASNVDIDQNAIIVKPDYHILTLGLGAEVPTYDNITDRDKLNRFINNARREYSFIIYDIPFEAITEFSGLVYACDSILMTCEWSNSALYNFLQAICNLDNEDVISTLFRRAKLLFTKDTGNRKILDMSVDPLTVHKALDRKLLMLLGEDIGVTFSTLEFIGSLSYSDEYDKLWSTNKKVIDRSDFYDEYVEVIRQVFMKGK